MDIQNITNKLYQRYAKHQSDIKQRIGLSFDSTFSFITTWLDSYNSYIEEYYLSGKINKFPEEQKHIINHPLINYTWDWRIHKHFIQKLKCLSLEEIYQVIYQIEDICQGNFSHLKRIVAQTTVTLHMTEFLLERNTLPGLNMLIMIGIEKVPTLDRNQKKVERFDFKQFIMFLNLVNSNENIDGYYINKRYEDIFNDPSRSGFVIDPITTNPKGNNQFFFQYSTYINGEGKYQTKRKVERSDRIWHNFTEINKYSDFESAANLVDLLKNVTNLNIKLTEEERNAIGQYGNTIVIGRSGTGKTTCALLRLFAFEIVFRMRIKIKFNENKKVLKDVLSNQPIGLQSVFVTASPVLANKIQRYYKQFVTNIRGEIKKKQKEKEDKLQREQENQQMQDNSNGNEEEIKKKMNLLTNSINSKHDSDTSFEKIETENIQNIVEDQIEQFKIPEGEEDENNQVDDQAVDNGDDEFEDDEQNQNFVLSEQATKHKSLRELNSQDFPAFLTVKQYLMLIEGCLLNPFFERDLEGKIVNQEGQSSWNNYKSQKEKKQLKITTKNKEEDDVKYFTKNNMEDFTFLLTHRRADEKVKTIELEPSDRRFEVDYQYFENIFWPVAQVKFKDSSLITCYILWTEIYYSIKGSKIYSILGMESYKTSSENSLLSLAQREVVYSMFQYYEAWKAKQYGYDQMDLVLFIEKEIRSYSYDIPSIHFTTIDEIQDLPLKIIEIFRSINEHSYFFGGDSAQSIARGVGFKFQDLKKHSPYLGCQDTIHQLTVNFRSHNKILQLSNSVISLLEGLFPMSIDILKKERSNLNGLKPIVLVDADIQFLFSLLQGQSSEQGFIPLDFGCNQVIIVKDDESKLKIPPILEHAICLTIKEAKGLEFDDVVLFDFFSDSKSTVNQWDSVKLLTVHEETIPKDLFLKTITQHNVENQKNPDQMDVETFENTYGVEYDKEKNEVQVFNVVTKNVDLKTFDRVSHSQLCQEFKQLYTAITRPKQKLIIFDQNTLKRQSITKYWAEQNLVTTISSKDVEESGSSEATTAELTKKEISKKMEKDNIIKMLHKLLVQNTKEEWFEQGLKMFKHKYFEQAVKCFKKSGHPDFEKKAQAYFEASNISAEVMKLDNELTLLKQNIGQYVSLKGSAKATARNDLLKQLKIKKQSFIEVGEQFLLINRKKQAAQCFFSAEQYERSAEIYSQLNQYREAAEAYQLSCKNPMKAALLYEKVKDYDKAISCLESAQEWIQILSLIQRNQQNLNPDSIEKLKEKYITLAFQNIRSIIEKSNKQNEKPATILNETIQENESDESLSSFDSDFFEDEENNENESQDEDKSEIKQQQRIGYVTKDIEDIENDDDQSQQQNASKQEKLKSYMKSSRKYQNEDQDQEQEYEEEIETEEQQEPSIRSLKNKLSSQMKKLKQKSEKIETVKEADNKIIECQDESIIDDNKNKLEKSLSNSYSIIEKDQSINIQDISFDNFSDLDPLDQILKKQLSQSIYSVAQSDYSILDISQVNINQKALLIQTKEQVNITDESLICVLEVISLIDPSILDLLAKFIKNNSETELVINMSSRSQISQLQGIEQLDLNNLDKSIIEKVLDVLEQFNQAMIQLQICNRFKIFSRINKIVPQLSLKHSPLSLTNCQVQQTHFISQLSYLKRRHREQALIANTGLHTIFESISPDYLNPQILIQSQIQQVKEPIFSQDCFKSLILQGYWKRILYLMDKKDALVVALAYGDFTSYKFISLQGQTDQQSQIPLIAPNFNNLPSELNNSCEFTQLAIIYMEDFNYQAINKGFNNPIPFQNVDIPSYFKYHKAIWNRFQNRESNQESLNILLELLNEVIQILSNKNSNHSQLQIFDAISSFNLILLYNQQFKSLQDAPEKILKLFVNAANLIKDVVRDYNNITDKRSQSVIYAILSAYQVRMLPSSSNECTSILGKNKAILQKSNLLVYSLIKNYKQIDNQDLITYCDVECENILAPLNVILLLINRRIQPLLESIIGKSISLNNSKDDILTKTKNSQNKVQSTKRIFNEQDYFEFYLKDELEQENNQSYKNKSRICVTHKDEIFSKLDEYQSFLIFGLTEKYNELQFNTYKKLLIEQSNYFLSEQVLVNIIINCQENKEIKLLIPQEDTQFFFVLSQNQSVVYKFEQENNHLSFNLNVYDNVEDVDEICQIILRAVKIADRKQQAILFKMIFTILINIQEIELESLSDLISALQLLDWSPEIQEFLNENHFYQSLLESQNVNDAKELAYDFALTEEFESLFFKWEDVNIINRVKLINSFNSILFFVRDIFKVKKIFLIKVQQGKNEQRFQEEQKLFINSQSLKESKVKIIQRFLKKNKDQLHYINQVSLKFQNLSEFYNIQDQVSHKNFVSQFQLCLVSQEEAAISFDLIKQISKDIINTFYCQLFVSIELFNLVIDTLTQTDKYFLELSNIFKSAVNSGLENTYKKYSYYQQFLNLQEKIQDFNKSFRTKLNMILIKLNGEAQIKKKSCNLSSQLNPADQKVLKLMKKQKNIQKQQLNRNKKEIKLDYGQKYYYY